MFDSIKKNPNLTLTKSKVKFKYISEENLTCKILRLDTRVFLCLSLDLDSDSGRMTKENGQI